MASMPGPETTLSSLAMREGAGMPCPYRVELISCSLVIFRGVWNVPFISQAVLLSGRWLRETAHDLPSWESQVLDTDMALAAWMREKVWQDPLSPGHSVCLSFACVCLSLYIPGQVHAC